MSESFEFGSVWIGDQTQPAIVKRGTKVNHVVHRDGPVMRVTKIEGRIRIEPLAGRKQYTLQSLAKRMLQRKDALGIKTEFTKAAKAILEEAAAQP